MAGKGSAEGCCASCAKWCLIIFNILFCLIGVGLIAAGAYAYIALSDYLQLFGDNSMLNAPAIVLIVFGCITFFIAAIGCFGACKESACLLFTFAAIVGILLIAEIAAGVAALVYSNELEAWFDEAAPKTMKTYEEGTKNVAVDAWDLVQTTFNCCGINGSADWNLINSPKQPGPPKSCGTPAEALLRNDCKSALIAFVEENIIIIAGVGIGFGLIELLGIVFACCVGCNIRKGTNV